MAGIGFELKHRIPDASLLGHARRLSFAAVIAGGPWIFSIITLLIMTIISLHAGMSRQSLQQFLVTNTYLIAHAQIISGGFQLTLTRYTADLIFTQQQHLVFGNLLGNVIIVSVISMPIGVWLATSLHTMPLAFRCHSAMALPIFCIIWVCILFLSSIKAYRAMTAALLFSYGCIVMQVLLADSHSPTQLLLAFVSGHLIAVLLLMILIWRAYPGHLTVSFSALRWTPTTRRLMLCGLFYNSAIWIDKFIFWLSPGLSKPIAGWFHASLIYDLPIFLANVAIIPGLAIFLLTTETDFATKCQRYFKRLNADATLNELLELKQDLVNSYREGLILLCKVQALTSLILFTII
ncbi:MAG: exopolysaccharide Pel transporter PelG [Gammaproteobacteria bacterium]